MSVVGVSHLLGTPLELTLRMYTWSFFAITDSASSVHFFEVEAYIKLNFFPNGLTMDAWSR